MVETNAAATYENKHVRIVSVHDVTYKADGQIVGKVTVEHGKNATAPEIPAKEGYNETAPKWDKDGKNITADTEINAVYTKNQPGEYADVTPDTNGSLALTGDGAGISASGNLIINECQVNATGIASNGTIAITNSFVTANGARYGIAVVHAKEGVATEMKSDDLTITNSTVVATGGEYALFYDGGHNEEDESSIRGGLIPKLVFDNKFAAVAGNDA